VFLSFDALAADVYWIRTIQHYGRDRKSTRTIDRFALLEPLLDVTTTLDPRFVIAYRFGAIFLSLPPPNGSGQVDRAIALLEKGLKADPDRWQYALDIGFIHYWHTGRFEQAGRWFAQTAGMPRAPIWIKPLAAITLAQGGDRQGARELLGNLANSEESWIRQAASRGLAQIEALDRIDAVQALVDRYFAEHQRYPASWRDIAPPSSPTAVPVDPANVPLEFDARTHRVVLSLQSPLGPLPALPSRK
jgi:tetratricopeptide (TPR) repeat protein